MANLCKNVVTITSNKDDIIKIKNRLMNYSNGNCFDFNSLIKMPDELADTQQIFIKYPKVEGKNYYYSRKKLEESGKEYPSTEWVKDNCIDEFTLSRYVSTHNFLWWYDWAIENWGTKWNSLDATFEIDDDCITYTFYTAWAEPIPVYGALLQYLFNPIRNTPFKNTEHIQLKWYFEDEAEHFSGWLSPSALQDND